MSDNDENEQRKPSPAEFDLYLPWACKQLQLDVTVNVERVQQQEYVSAMSTDRTKHKGKSKPKLAYSKQEVASDQDKEDSFQMPTCDQMNILAFYDSCENLVHIKFDRNWQIPRAVFKIIGLIIQFQVQLTTFTINLGLDMYVIHELAKFLAMSHITEVCLDGTFLPQANYHILLEKQNFLIYLSLARCRIEDSVIENLASMLVHPLPASKTLRCLNLSSNRITDLGAECLSTTLRSNRSLYYLNIADNEITDTGAASILNSLEQFPIITEEVWSSKSRNISFLKNREEFIQKTIKDLKTSEFDKRAIRRKSTRPPTTSAKKGKSIDKETSLKCLTEINPKSMLNMEAFWLERAKAIADDVLGEFDDPFSSSNTIYKDGVLYCCGNNTLCYLNMAYNNLSLFTINRLLSVVAEQARLNRKPKGLINVNIEGNNLPKSCKELSELDNMLEMELMACCKRISSVKKKITSKSSK